MIEKFMKKYLNIALVFVLALGLLSCSSSSGGGDDSGPGAPSLSNLRFPSVTYRGEPCVVSLDFADPEGDITRLYSTETYGGGKSNTESFAADELGISGTSGTVTFVHITNTQAALGNHHFEIWVEDDGHHTSNRLIHDLDIR